MLDDEDDEDDDFVLSNGILYIITCVVASKPPGPEYPSRANEVRKSLKGKKAPSFRKQARMASLFICVSKAS